VHVSNLRRKLDAAVPDAEPIVETMRGRGYRLAPGGAWDPDAADSLDTADGLEAEDNQGAGDGR
jgi:DNA-binding winged helix-turn-helix (wHTH) protein